MLIQANEDLFDNTIETMQTTLNTQFDTEVQGPYDAHKLLVDEKIEDLLEWFVSEPTERDAEDVLIQAKLDSWEAGFLDLQDFNWPGLATASIELADATHAETVACNDEHIANQTTSIDEYVQTQALASQGDMEQALIDLETDLTALVDANLLATRTTIEADVAASWAEIESYQTDSINELHTEMTDLIESYESDIFAELSYGTNDLALLESDVDDAVAAVLVVVNTDIAGKYIIIKKM